MSRGLVSSLLVGDVLYEKDPRPAKSCEPQRKFARRVAATWQRSVGVRDCAGIHPTRVLPNAFHLESIGPEYPYGR